MESGLEDRNNMHFDGPWILEVRRLNGVRPRRPEQSTPRRGRLRRVRRVSMESGLEDRNNAHPLWVPLTCWDVSMESGLEDRNNADLAGVRKEALTSSQWSPA